MARRTRRLTMETLSIGLEPAQIEPGRKIRLTSSVVTAAYPYKYEWRIYEAGPARKLVFQQTTEGPSAVWDTPKDLPTGPYDMEVKCFPASGTLAKSAEEGAGNAALYVNERTMSRADLYDVKQNVDHQIQALAKEVGN